MYLLRAACITLLAGTVAAACTIQGTDCSKNPELSCYAGASGSGGTGTGGGGTGGGPPCGGGVCPNGPGVTCTSAGECESGFCADGVCCATACDGLCEACDLEGAKGTCSPLPAETIDDTVVDGESCGADKGGCGETAGYCRCDDGVPNGDETDVDCGGATCGKKCGTGSSCLDANGSDCWSGNCVDGYCCNAACDGECVACDVADHSGLCSAVAPGTPDVCIAPASCGVTGVCAMAEGESCLIDYECASRLCSATNICISCSDPVACGGGRACIDGACFDSADGKPCQNNDSCAGGHCVDGVCCATACDGDCMGCHNNYTAKPNGTCAPILPGHDPHDECSGPGAAANCSGAFADGSSDASSCGKP